MHNANLTDAQRIQRANLRNFLLTATIAELNKESEIRRQRGDLFAVRCINELINEAIAEEGINDNR